MQPDELNLLEDGLQLWLVALRNAPGPQPDLLALFPHLVAAMERSTEHIAVGMKIATSCVLLGECEWLMLYQVEKLARNNFPAAASTF